MSITTADEFNEKYKNYLTEGFYGLAINDERVVIQLDDLFENVFTKIEGFEYQQIKLKFGRGVFYSNLEGLCIKYMVNGLINNILEDKS